MPKISLIIPVYNVQDYIGECLDSIINQTIKDIEIICINDGSTDNSASIIQDYSRKDARIVVLNQQNSGISVARNNGLDAAKGEFVAFIDSDDYLYSNDYLEKLLDACEKYNADIAVASVIRGNSKRADVILNVDKYSVTSDYFEKLKICDCPDSNYVWNKLYRKSTLIKSGIKFLSGKKYEDVYYTHKVLYYLETLVGVPNIWYFYRKRKGSTVKAKSSKANTDHADGEKEMYKFFKEKNIDVSSIATVKKKYKIFGFTVFKTLTKNKKRKNILFSLIKWKSRIKD